MQDEDLRAYVLDRVDAKWQYPVGHDIFSQFAGGEAYVCMTEKAINFWHEGKLELSIAHDAETRSWYEHLLQRKPKSA